MKATFDVAAFAGESDKVACLCTILLIIRTLIGCVDLHRLDSENVNVSVEVSVSIDAYLGYASPATEVILGKS